MNRQVGFTRKILGVLEDNNISFDHMPSGIDTISIVMRSKQIQNKETKVLNEIRQKCDVDELSIEHDLAILMIVGEGMNKVIGTANKITHALAESKINLKMINQGASEISMMFGIHVDDAEKAVLSTYEFCYHGVALKTCVIKTNIKAIRNTCIQLRYELLFLNYLLFSGLHP